MLLQAQDQESITKHTAFLNRHLTFSKDLCSSETDDTVVLGEMPLPGVAPNLLSRWFTGTPQKGSRTSGCFSRQAKAWRDEWKVSIDLLLLGSAPPDPSVPGTALEVWPWGHPAERSPGSPSRNTNKPRRTGTFSFGPEKKALERRILISLITSKYSWVFESGGLFFHCLYFHDGSWKIFTLHSSDFYRGLVENRIFSNVHQKGMRNYTQ